MSRPNVVFAWTEYSLTWVWSSGDHHWPPQARKQGGFGGSEEPPIVLGANMKSC